MQLQTEESVLMLPRRLNVENASKRK